MDLGELVAKLKLDPSGFSKGAKEAGGMLQGLGGTLAKVGGAFAAFEVGKKVFDFFKDAAKEAQAFEDVFAGLSTVMKNQGATGAAVDGMRSYIDKVRIATGATADSLVPGLTKLQAATHNTKRSQDDMNVALDVAAGRHMDVSAVATAMGKAEQGNMTALQRLGIAVKDAHGKMLPLDQIMGKLKATYGGAAAAIMNVDPWKKLGAMWDVMKEKLGAALLPALSRVANWIIGHFPQIESVVGKVASVIGKVLGWVADKALPVLVRAFGWFQKNVLPVLETIGHVIGVVFGAFKTDGVSGGMSKIGGIIAQYAPVIFNALLKLGERFLKWIGPHIPGMLKELGKLLARLENWFYLTALPAIERKLVQWAKAFAAWIGPMIPPMLKELGKILLKIGEWIITKALPSIIVNLGKLVIGLVQALGTLLEPLGRAILNGLWTGIQWIWKTVSGFFSGIGGTIKGFFVGAVKWLESIGNDILNGLWNGMKWIWDNTVVPFLDLGSKIKTAVGDLSTLLYNVGSDIINGLWNGMKAVWDSVIGWAGRIANGLSSAVKSVLGIKSPSTVFYGHGANIMKGLHLGMQSEFGNLQKTMSKANGILSTQAPGRKAAPAGARTPTRRYNGPASQGASARGGVTVIVGNSYEAQQARRVLRAKMAWQS